MEMFFGANLAAAIVAVVAMALAPPRAFKVIAILLGAGAAGFFFWAVDFSQSCASDGCIGVIIPGVLCAACVAALAVGSLARWIVTSVRGRTRPSGN